MSSGNHTPQLPAGAQMMQMIIGGWIARAISVAAELGIADHLAGGAKTPEELASATRSHAPSSYRLLRALASLGLFAEGAGRRFSLTPLGETLRSDAPDSLRHLARFIGMPAAWRSWQEFLHSVRTGETGFRKAFAMESPFEHLTNHPEEAAIFDAAMTDNSRQSAPAVAQAYDFSRFRELVDIAGGRGYLLATVLQRNPALRGILFDLPHVVEGAAPVMAAHGIDGRCELVGGDFFQSVPHGAEAYMMKHIIHDWDDERSVAILRNIRRAIDPAGRLLIVEIVIGPGNEPSLGKLLDLEMLAIPGGRERTPDEYRDLFAASGFGLHAIHPTAAPHSVIEAVPAAS